MTINFLKQLICNCDSPERFQFGFQDPASPVVEGMMIFHDFLVFFSIIIAVFVFFMLSVIIINFNETKNKVPEKFTHSSLLEIAWTIIPAFSLIFVAIPSFSLLYSLEELMNPSMTLKIIGHQWYWSYEYSDSIYLDESISYDAYMMGVEDFDSVDRLLFTDNRVIIPTKTHVRLLISSADVLHSWAVPSFGIKVDACPGRLSQASLFIKREGLFYGQCSEICGVNHGFMPISISGEDKEAFPYWMWYKQYEIMLKQQEKGSLI